MTTLNPLLKAIGEVKNPLMRIILIAAVIIITILWRSDVNTKQRLIDSSKERLVEKDKDFIGLKIEKKISDSLYQDCGKQRYEDALQTRQSVDRREKLNDTIKKLVIKIP